MVSSMLPPDITPSVSPDAPRTPKLLDQVRARLPTKHYSIRTEDQYVHWIRRFILSSLRFFVMLHPYSVTAPTETTVG